MQNKPMKKMLMVDEEQTLKFADSEVQMQHEALGSMYQADKDCYILAFDEVIGDEKMTVTVKVDRGNIYFVTIGGVHTRCALVKGDWADYQFFYGGGNYKCRTFTRKLEYAITPDGGIIDVEYEIWNGLEKLVEVRKDLFLR